MIITFFRPALIYVWLLALSVMISSCVGPRATFNPVSDKPVRVALLLPLTAKNEQVRKLARFLSDAAQMALFDAGKSRLVLILQDTKGTVQGAKQAMQDSLDKESHIILGPLLSSSVRAIAPLAKSYNVPIISFSNDESVISDNVYLLGFSPRQQIERIIRHATTLNITKIAAFLPRTAYGSLVREAFVNSASASGLDIHIIETYPNTVKGAMEPARRLADFTWRRKAREQEMRRLDRAIAQAQGELKRQSSSRANQSGPVRGQLSRGGASSVPPEARLKSAKAEKNRLRKIDALGEVPYQAILLCEGGDLLKGLVQLLPNFDVRPDRVFFLGTGKWDDPKLGLERPLKGARFAAPPFDKAMILLLRMRDQYRRGLPPRLATLGYDAVGLALTLAQQGDPPFEYEQLTQEGGFVGIDGIYRFPKNDDGAKGAIAQRGLAVIEIKRKEREIISNAPTYFPES